MILALSVVIATTSTFYLTKILLIKELYVLNISCLFFSQCGIFICMPPILNKTFGSKNFAAIYGFMLISSVIICNTTVIFKKTNVTLLTIFRPSPQHL
jgi:hypothetical protein